MVFAVLSPQQHFSPVQMKFALFQSVSLSIAQMNVIEMDFQFGFHTTFPTLQAISG